MAIGYSPDRVREIIDDYFNGVELDYLDGPIRYINAYEVDQAYGGPEEGDWYFTTYEPISSISVRNHKEAIDAFNYLYDRFHEEYEERTSMYSVASEGDLLICVEHKMAKYKPTERPHYE